MEAVNEGIRWGVYVLQDYAASYWFDHILRGSTGRKTSGCPEDVTRCVEEMIERRKNWTWEGSCTDGAPLVSLKCIEEEAPEVYDTLMDVHSFLERRWRELSLADGKSACRFRRLYALTQIFPGDSWVNEDPLTISATQLRVHGLLEAALCPSSNHRQGCQCAKMQRQYGSRLFKCNRFACPYFRSGFETKPDRDRHLRVHDRPYRCDRPNCDFSGMGFGSQARLNVHLQYHEKQARKPVAHLADIENDENVVELIILDAVKADDVDLVRDFIADVPRFSQKLLKQAVISSSCEMLDVLLEACNDGLVQIVGYNLLSLLDGAVLADNLEATRMLLNRGASLKHNDVDKYKFPGIREAIEIISPEMMKILLSDRRVQELIAEDRWVKPVFYNVFISGGWIRSKEARFIQCLSLLPDWTEKKERFDGLFTSNAKGPCSIAIAEFLLKNGTDINTRVKGSNTALLYASNKSSRAAAEFMKFLLESGADPLTPLTKTCKPIPDQRGPRNISKWLGISWEQLVEESRKKHAASLEMRPQ